MNLREREAMEANGMLPKTERTTRLPLSVSQHETERQAEYEAAIKAAYNEGFIEGRESEKASLGKEITHLTGVIAGLERALEIFGGTTHELKIAEQDAPRPIRVIDALQSIDAETFVEVRRADDVATVCDSGTPAELMEANRECLYTNVAEIEPRAAGYVVIFGYAEEKAAQEAPIEAKWEDANTPASYKCSACGGAPMYSKPEHAPEQYDRAFLTLSKFCPHCGAKMASPTDDDEDDESEEVQNGGV